MSRSNSAPSSRRSWASWSRTRCPSTSSTRAPARPSATSSPWRPANALRAIAAFRLALPRTILRYAGGRELTLGDLGTRDGLLGGINAVIVGNYLTTLGRDPREDLALLDELEMPIKALNETF